jgi:hypothetical protein
MLTLARTSYPMSFHTPLAMTSNPVAHWQSAIPDSTSATHPPAGLRHTAPGGSRSCRQPLPRRLTLARIEVAGWLLCLACLLPSARAVLSEPDNLLYGIVVLGTNQVTAADTDVLIEARRTNGLLVGRYVMGSRSDAGNYFLLALKVEDREPRRDPSSVLRNETLAIRVTRLGLQEAQQSYTVAERGQVQRLDFGALPTNGPSGFEAWAQARGVGAPEADDDRDGVSNYDEYVAGTNPKDPASRFALAVSRANGSNQVAFLAGKAEGSGYENLDRYFSLESRTNLNDSAWAGVGGFTNILGANQPVVFLSPGTNALPVFYRGKVGLRDH